MASPTRLRVGTDTAEIYDPAKASFLATNKPMVVGRWVIRRRCFQTAPFYSSEGKWKLSCGDLQSVRWFVLGYRDRRLRPSGHTATLLKNGSVLIIGGTTAELYQ